MYLHRYSNTESLLSLNQRNAQPSDTVITRFARSQLSHLPLHI